jgi:hypothetical protein
MRAMRPLTTAGGLVIMMCLTLGAEPASQPASAQQGLDMLKKMVGGEWTVEAKWSDGSPLKAREAFEMGAGDRFVYCKTFASRADGTEYMRYNTMFGVMDGKLTAWAFSYDGTAETSTMEVDGNTLWIKREVKSGEGKAILKQSITLVDNDHFNWKVWMESGASTTQLMDGMWVRRGNAAKK